jgi:hypothetical protein
LEFRFWRPHNKYVKREDLEDAVMP